MERWPPYAASMSAVPPRLLRRSTLAPRFKTLVVGESTLSTLPCLGRCTGSGGPRGPPGGVLRVVTCSSTLSCGSRASFTLGATNPHDEGRLKWPDQCHPDSRETMTPHARRLRTRSEAESKMWLTKLNSGDDGRPGSAVDGTATGLAQFSRV
eukprot:scaffold4323_cov57-Phaeocystis_antarctica.AAC.1